MHCPSCGALNQFDNFCRLCGERLLDEDQTSAPTTPITVTLTLTPFSFPPSGKPVIPLSNIDADNATEPENTLQASGQPSGDVEEPPSLTEVDARETSRAPSSLMQQAVPHISALVCSLYLEVIGVALFFILGMLVLIALLSLREREPLNAGVEPQPTVEKPAATYIAPTPQPPITADRAAPSTPVASPMPSLTPMPLPAQPAAPMLQAPVYAPPNSNGEITLEGPPSSSLPYERRLLDDKHMVGLMREGDDLLVVFTATGTYRVRLRTPDGSTCAGCQEDKQVEVTSLGHADAATYRIRNVPDGAFQVNMEHGRACCVGHIAARSRKS